MKKKNIIEVKMNSEDLIGYLECEYTNLDKNRVTFVEFIKQLALRNNIRLIYKNVNPINSLVNSLKLVWSSIYCSEILHALISLLALLTQSIGSMLDTKDDKNGKLESIVIYHKGWTLNIYTSIISNSKKVELELYYFMLTEIFIEILKKNNCFSSDNKKYINKMTFLLGTNSKLVKHVPDYKRLNEFLNFIKNDLSKIGLVKI